MPETDQQDKTLSELVVKEAVERGLESPMRDSILEAVDEAEGSSKRRQLPLAGAVFGLGAALGFLAGQQSSDAETPSLEDVEEPDIIEDINEKATEQAAETDLIDEQPDDDQSGSRLPRLVLALGVIAGAALVGRRLLGGEDEEWEPIEEFEPATESDVGDESTDDEPDEAEVETADEDETEE
ncbi:hypothetical protein D8Y22_06770 [Salinadaptatus halalkaliphilus]|uniref:Uncharacterized protein n=1 Tax=Salinadaptatus halalkaliphilus TaxID=2419781 RepID=A0A4S3TMX7_9EURY|nr:hypothetical protein [Salinadaptatus halalkaliphilus]THE65629.1 hypothetical protein D8Y22_06770 [Salinadaptatus halalkaliphilus]